jgi:hypothetical protein
MLLLDKGSLILFRLPESRNDFDEGQHRGGLASLGH